MTPISLKTVLNSITVIVDTREHENDHIIKLFDNKSIPYIRRCLKFGDYSFEIPACPEHGIPETISFEKHLVYERKANLTELSGNICQNRKRFEKEFEEANEAEAKIILLVENGGWQGIIDHEYRTELSPKSYIASLLSFQARYGIYIEFLPSKLSGWLMYQTFKYHAREFLNCGIGIKEGL